MEKISTFLEGVKAGYADRFDLMFQAMGIEDLSDVRDMSEARLVQLRLVLRKGGAKPIQLDRINDAMDQIRLGKPPTAKKRPKSATTRHRHQVPLHIYTPCVAVGGEGGNRQPRPPPNRRPQSAPAARRPQSAPPARRYTQATAAAGEDVKKVPEAPPVVMQRCSSGWQPRDESRKQVWERLVTVPKKPTFEDAPSSPAAARRTVRVSKQSGEQYPYSWELDGDRQKVWERLLKNTREKKTIHPRSLSPRPFVSPGPTATTPSMAATTKSNAVATAEKVVVFQRNKRWSWAMPQSRRGVWDRLLARRETKEMPQQQHSPFPPSLNKNQRVVSIDKIDQDAKAQTGLFKPLRVNGEHVQARLDRERFDAERRSSQRFVHVKNHPAHQQPRRFPLDLLLKTWTLEQIQATVNERKSVVVVAGESPAPAVHHDTSTS